MDVDVTAMAFERDTARATVLFKVKNGDGGMQMNYTLDRKGDKWVVRPNTDGGAGHGVAVPPNDDPGAGKLPPGHRRCRPRARNNEDGSCLRRRSRGASAAERLARAGLNTMVFDEKLAWEKPCGGGLTYKAYDQYPYLLNNDTPKKLIRETVVGAPGAGEAKMTLTQPLLIYSRFDLNRMLLSARNALARPWSRPASWGSSGTTQAGSCELATGRPKPIS